jgi:hypothetical protein
MAGCAANEATTAAPDKPDELEFSIPEAPPRPEYHAESDAVSFDRRESRTLKKAACADLDEPSACRYQSSSNRDNQDQANTRLHGYRGSFTRPGADEALVMLPDAAVLFARTDGRWHTKARAQKVDIDHCLLADPTDADHDQPDVAPPNNLLCRAAAAGDQGFGLAFFRLSAAEDGQLEVRPLDTPRTTDVDTSLFAGWKREDDGIEVRFHKASAVESATTLSFDGPGGCRYRVFGYDQGPQPALVELDDCSDAATDGATDGATDEANKVPASRRSGQYETRLDGPIKAHNRDYVMCYHHELKRLKKLADQHSAETSEEDDEPTEPIAGDIHVRFVIGASGAPVSCEVATSTMDNQNVETCLCREIMDTPFPPVPKGNFVDVSYPFSFAPAAE